MDPKLVKRYESICTAVLLFYFSSLIKKEMPTFTWSPLVCTPWSHATPLKLRSTKAMKKIVT